MTHFEYICFIMLYQTWYVILSQSKLNKQFFFFCVGYCLQSNDNKCQHDPATIVFHKFLMLYGCVCAWKCLCVCLYVSWQPYLHPPWVRSHFRQDSSKITAPLFPPHTLHTHTLTHLLLPLNTAAHRSRLDLDFLSLPEIARRNLTSNTSIHKQNNGVICLLLVSIHLVIHDHSNTQTYLNQHISKHDLY